MKTLEIGSSGIVALAAQVARWTSGWYRVAATGQLVYYDAVSDTLYTAQGGIYIPLGYMNPAPKQVALAPGDRLKIILSFKYKGPAVTGILSRWCIGVFGLSGFTEGVIITPTLDIPANNSTTPITVTKEQILTISASPGTDWDDIYVKMWGGTPDLGGNEQFPAYIYGYENALIIAGVQPSITEFKISDFAKV